MESRENNTEKKEFETIKNSVLWRYLFAIADDDIWVFYTRYLLFTDRTPEEDKERIVLKSKQIKLSELCKNNLFPQGHPYKQKLTAEHLQGLAKNILAILSPEQKTLDEIAWKNFWKSSPEKEQDAVFLMYKEMESIFALIHAILHLPSSRRGSNVQVTALEYLNIIAGNSKVKLRLTSRELILINNYYIELLPRLIYLAGDKGVASAPEKTHIQTMLRELSLANWFSYLIYFNTHPYTINYSEFEEAFKFAIDNEIISFSEDVSRELLTIASQIAQIAQIASQQEKSSVWETTLSHALRNDILINELEDDELVELVVGLTPKRFELIVSSDKFNSLMERVDLKIFAVLLEKKHHPFLEIMLAQREFLAKRFSWEEIGKLKDRIPQESYSKLLGFPSFADKLNKVSDEHQRREILRELACSKLFIVAKILKLYAKYLKSEDLEIIKKAHPVQLDSDLLKKASEAIKREENKKLPVSEDKTKIEKAKDKEKPEEKKEKTAKEKKKVEDKDEKSLKRNSFFSRLSKKEEKKPCQNSLGQGCGRG